MEIVVQCIYQNKSNKNKSITHHREKTRIVDRTHIDFFSRQV